MCGFCVCVCVCVCVLPLRLDKPTPSPEMSPVSAELSKQMNSLMELIQNYEE